MNSFEIQLPHYFYISTTMSIQLYSFGIITNKKPSRLRNKSIIILEDIIMEFEYLLGVKLILLCLHEFMQIKKPNRL